MILSGISLLPIVVSIFENGICSQLMNNHSKVIRDILYD